MFGLGMGELLLIAVVALLFVGPDKLPDAARAIGRGLRDIRKQTDDLQSSLEEDTEVGDAVRELRSAWYGTARALPRTRRDLGRALESISRDEPSEKAGRDEPSEKAGRDEPAAREGGATGAGAAPATDSPDAAAADETVRERAGGDASPEPDPEDGLPRIAAPAGVIARDAGPADDGEGDETSEQPPSPRKPAHG